METVDFDKPLAHVFVCANARRPEQRMPSCGPNGGTEVFQAVHQWVRRRGLLGRVWVTRTACLGFCHDDGVTVITYPGGVVRRGVSVGDVDALMTAAVPPSVPPP